MKSALVTGHLGLVGRAVAERLLASGWTVYGLDNEGRSEFFHTPPAHIPPGIYTSLVDISDRDMVNNHWPGDIELVVHCAAQPSHDWSARAPLRDFDVNAVGTLNLLEECRTRTPNATFVFLSTNKVYGDTPNQVGFREGERRYWVDTKNGVWPGWCETTCVDRCTHSPFGAGKLAADVYVQEYGRYFGLKTVCLRAGCLTGRRHQGVELHGFLAYLFKCVRENRLYTIYGHRGKQVRDNLHANDVASLVEIIAMDPPEPGEVYNIGGGFENSCSIVEAIDAAQRLTGKTLHVEYCNKPRVGDHVVYYTDLHKVRTRYTQWEIAYDLDHIYAELAFPEDKSDENGRATLSTQAAECSGRLSG